MARVCPKCGAVRKKRALCNRCYLAEYRAANPEKAAEERARNREWKLNNPEKVREYARVWDAKNPEKILAKSKRAQARHCENLSDSYIKNQNALPPDAPKEVIEVYRVILQIKRELRK